VIFKIFRFLPRLFGLRALGSDNKVNADYPNYPYYSDFPSYSNFLSLLRSQLDSLEILMRISLRRDNAIINPTSTWESTFFLV
jgi:hypothetical protein